MKMRFPTYWIGEGTEVKEGSAAATPIYGISLFTLAVYGSYANSEKK